MFDPAETPRFFGLPPGADFPAEVIRGLELRLAGRPPEDWAQVEIFVNTARTQRRLMALFAAGPPRLLPKVRLLTRLAADPLLTDLPPAIPPLRRRLDLAQLVRRLLDADPTLAPRSAATDLADSLASLFDEMDGEGVGWETIDRLDIADLSGHWARALRFLAIARDYVSDDAPSAEARLRRAAEALAARWAVEPPDHPVLVAGSTGSRGPVALLMHAVAAFPQGAVILPGVDRHMPADVWDCLDDPLTGEDHPQFRFARLARSAGLHPTAIRPWTDADPVPARNALLSMALRPAPVTDQWRRDGPSLGDLRAATARLSLLEAADPGEESLAIALRLRRALEDGRTAALITPDRSLTRRVEATLDRWGLEADDSAGTPLQLTAPGRLLRQVARLLGGPPGPEPLLALLKQPIVHTGTDRGDHLRHTRNFELRLRDRGAPPGIMPATLAEWRADPDDPGPADWIAWLGSCLAELAEIRTAPLADLVLVHLAVTERLAAGGAPGAGTLWEEAAGRAAREQMEALAREADAGGAMAPRDYADLIDAHLGAAEVRRPDTARPDLMIWGTLEARVQGADLVVLAGLSEGTWPEPPPPDPWLNRPLRQKAGLLLPERRIGLSAHDFQQAAAATEVVFSRSRRDAEAETVLSRWLNRLTNLLGGLPETNGPQALAEMRSRGAVWVDYAREVSARERPAPPARRPAPRPPTEARPARLSVTDIQRLIRDPYAIYAARILRLRRLNPLRPEPDAPLRGEIFHAVFERVLADGLDPFAPDAPARLRALAAEELARVPWISTRALWQGQFDRVSDWFVEGERTRRAGATPLAREVPAEYPVPGTGVVLTGRADRIDRRDDGRLLLYDYKTGRVPGEKEIRHFDRQLLLEAVMGEAGAFAGVPQATVAEICHIGVGSDRSDTPHRLRDPDGDEMLDPDATLLGLQELLRAYAEPGKGYAALRAMRTMTHFSDFAHLARFGEWDLDAVACPEDVR